MGTMRAGHIIKALSNGEEAAAHIGPGPHMRLVQLHQFGAAFRPRDVIGDDDGSRM